MCNNRHFQKPTLSEFQDRARKALRTSQERDRQRVRPRTQARGNNRVNLRNFWNDEREEEGAQHD